MTNYEKPCDAPRGQRRCVLYEGHRGSHSYRTNTAGAPFKLCPKCGKLRRLSDEYVHRSDGSVFSWCKPCNTDYRRARAGAKRATP